MKMSKQIEDQVHKNYCYTFHSWDFCYLVLHNIKCFEIRSSWVIKMALFPITDSSNQQQLLSTNDKLFCCLCNRKAMVSLSEPERIKTNRHLYTDRQTYGTDTPSLEKLDDKQQCFLFLILSDSFRASNPPGPEAVIRKTDRSSLFKASKSLHHTSEWCQHWFTHTLSDKNTHRHILLPNTAPYTGLAVNCWVIIYAGKHKKTGWELFPNVLFPKPHTRSVPKIHCGLLQGI